MAEKVLLRIDEERRRQTIDQMQNAFDAYNDVVLWLREKEIDAEIPHETILKWCSKGMTYETVAEFVLTQFKDQNKYLANAARKLLMDELLKYPRANTMSLTVKDFTLLTFKNGLAQIPKGVYEQIEEDCKMYLTNEVEISRFKRHQAIIDQMNELYYEMRPNNTYYADAGTMLVGVGSDGQAVRKELFLTYADIERN